MRISAKTIEVAFSDLSEINTRLILLAFGDYFPSEHLEALRAGLKPAWQYKQPPPAWGANTKNPPKQKRPPRSSPASRREKHLGGSPRKPPLDQRARRRNVSYFNLLIAHRVHHAGRSPGGGTASMTPRATALRWPELVRYVQPPKSEG
jgi:hypothetical protein